MNPIKKVDLLIYNFYYISGEVIKHLIYKKKTKNRLFHKVEKFLKNILTWMTYKCVHCVNLSVNLFDDTVKGMCTVQTVNKFLT